MLLRFLGAIAPHLTGHILHVENSEPQYLQQDVFLRAMLDHMASAHPTVTFAAVILRLRAWKLWRCDEQKYKVKISDYWRQVAQKDGEQQSACFGDKGLLQQRFILRSQRLRLCLYLDNTGVLLSPKLMNQCEQWLHYRPKNEEALSATGERILQLGKAMGWDGRPVHLCIENVMEFVLRLVRVSF